MLMAEVECHLLQSENFVRCLNLPSPKKICMSKMPGNKPTRNSDCYIAHLGILNVCERKADVQPMNHSGVP